MTYSTYFEGTNRYGVYLRETVGPYKQLGTLHNRVAQRLQTLWPQGAFNNTQNACQGLVEYSQSSEERKYDRATYKIQRKEGPGVKAFFEFWPNDCVTPPR